MNRAEIDFFVHGYASGDIPDYQAAAWAMAIFLNGMSRQETVDLSLTKDKMMGMMPGLLLYLAREPEQVQPALARMMPMMAPISAYDFSSR